MGCHERAAHVHMAWYAKSLTGDLIAWSRRIVTNLQDICAVATLISFNLSSSNVGNIEDMTLMFRAMSMCLGMSLHVWANIPFARIGSSMARRQISILV